MVSEKMIDAAARVLNKRLAEGNGLHGVSRDMIEAALFADTDAAQSGGDVEKAAKLLWSRFAAPHHDDWENETNKSEYRLAASEILALNNHIEGMVTENMRVAACRALNERGRGNAVTISDVVAMLEAALSIHPAPNEEAAPRAWFVKDYADGWVHFDNEADALREVAATGAMMYVGFHPAHVSAPGAEVETLVKALKAAEEEFNRIACEDITETRNVSEALERCKSFADRGAVDTRSAIVAAARKEGN
ncbi:hypothetical protein RWE87_13530 [Sinorhizobium meliloti]|uniref:hypothetical protein n=1 Tax=Rhizobium meliloti TaxID=382 RepID=UPI00299DE44B|nr:hypothetical protein [Sinorhizobium meliloti]